MRATAYAHPQFTIAPIDSRLFGSFVEHLGRAIYKGIYEPTHPTANADGMRQDVIDLVRALDVPVVRYPGGNFVSAYAWEDGIGPREARPTRLDLAWHSSESNAVGIHEFASWAKAAQTEMMLAVNLGSRGLAEARDFVEYVNHPAGSALSDLRAQNGQAEPWGVSMWCLGNEMDGPWQIGHKTAHEYGRLASETAKALRAFDPKMQLIVCGSSNPDMPTYPEWERTVLDLCYNDIDYISLHMYFSDRTRDTPAFLAKNLRMEGYIDTVAGIIAGAKAKARSQKDVYICFDEWNVWYHSNEADRATLAGQNGWPHAPALLEDIYDVQDALLVACLINSFLRRADVVKIACLAQLVNVIAPIMTVPNGPAWRQTIYHPFHLASRHGRGEALQLRVDCPSYAVEGIGDVPFLDIAATRHNGEVTLFIVNRHEGEAVDLTLPLTGFGLTRVADDVLLHHADRYATNGPDAEVLAPQPSHDAALAGDSLTAKIAPLSYRMIRLS